LPSTPPSISYFSNCWFVVVEDHRITNTTRWGHYPFILSRLNGAKISGKKCTGLFAIREQAQWKMDVAALVNLEIGQAPLVRVVKFAKTILYFLQIFKFPAFEKFQLRSLPVVCHWSASSLPPRWPEWARLGVYRYVSPRPWMRQSVAIIDGLDKRMDPGPKIVNASDSTNCVPTSRPTLLPLISVFGSTFGCSKKRWCRPLDVIRSVKAKVAPLRIHCRQRGRK
jgi:hypothetical protein